MTQSSCSFLGAEMSISNGILFMITSALEAVGIARSRLVDCPKCGKTMKRIRRNPPRKPYYMDFAHYCDLCDHEVEADRILPNSGKGRTSN